MTADTTALHDPGAWSPNHPVTTDLSVQGQVFTP